MSSYETVPSAAAERPDLEQISRFLAAPPPREVPGSIRRARLPRGPLAFAGTIVVLVLLLSVPLLARVFPDRLVDDLALSWGEPAVVPGVVTAVEPTGTSVRRPDVERPVPIERVTFRYTLPDAERSGQSHGALLDLATGSPVVVEVDLDAPERARIAGTTLSRTPLLGAFALLFPGLATIWLITVVRSRRHGLRLLRDGEFTFADVVDVESTRAKSTPARRDVVLLRRRDRPDAALVELRPRGRSLQLLQDRRRSGRPVTLLLDPRRPERRPLLIDSLLPATVPAGADEPDQS